jgi:hypothetical protein
VLCLYVLHDPLRIGLFNLLDAATVDWLFAADTLTLSLFFDGCFAVVAALADTLPLMSLRDPPHAGAAK